MNRYFKSFLFAILWVIFISGFSFQGYGQQLKKSKETKPSFEERIFIGGSLGFGIGNYSTLVDVSPIIGYAVTKEFIAGLGFTYKYYQYKDYYYNFVDNYFDDYKSNMYGMSIWARYFLTKTEIPIIENLFLHTEIEPLWFTNQYSYNPNGDFRDPYLTPMSKRNETINVIGIFVGGGLRQPIGNRSYMYLEIVWDLNEELYSPYSNPRIRIGFAAGF